MQPVGGRSPLHHPVVSGLERKIDIKVPSRNAEPQSTRQPEQGLIPTERIGELSPTSSPGASALCLPQQHRPSRPQGPCRCRCRRRPSPPLWLATAVYPKDAEISLKLDYLLEIFHMPVSSPCYCGNDLQKIILLISIQPSPHIAPYSQENGSGHCKGQPTLRRNPAIHYLCRSRPGDIWVRQHITSAAQVWPWLAWWFISSSFAPSWVFLCCTKSLQSCPTLCNPIDCSSPGSSVDGVSRQEYWSGLPFSPPGDFPDPVCLLHWQAGSLPLAPPGRPVLLLFIAHIFLTPEKCSFCFALVMVNMIKYLLDEFKIILTVTWKIRTSEN